MPERVNEFVQPLRDRWSAFDQAQKIRIAAAALVVIVALAIVVFLTTRTTYAVAARDLSDVDARQAATVLDENGIRNRLTPDGLGTAVEVDQSRRHEARVLIETMGLVADRNFTYEDALDFSGIGATEMVTRQNLQRARQNDLETALRAMDAVLWATVELNLPDENRWFVPSTNVATASIIVSTTRRLTANEGSSIARFISRSVRGLEMENIVVLDTEYNVLFSGDELEDDDSPLSDLMDLMVEERVRVTTSVRGMFIHNYDEVSVVPNLYYSPEFAEGEQVTFEAPIAEMEGGLPLSENILRATARGQQIAAEPGLMPNAATIPSYPFAIPSEMHATQDEQQRYFALNQFRRTWREIPSSYDRDLSTITVTLINRVEHRQETLAQRNGGSFDEHDWLDFQNETRHAPANITQEHLDAYARMISGATGIPLEHIQVFAWDTPVFVPQVQNDPNIGQFIMFGILALLLGLLAFSMIRSRTREEDVDEIEPELSVEGLLASTQMEEELEEDQLETISYADGIEAKHKLDTFIDEKPEAAASLLRHWLNEADDY
jgi:flagellar M-ring protein FliF